MGGYRTNLWRRCNTENIVKLCRQRWDYISLHSQAFTLQSGVWKRLLCGDPTSPRRMKALQNKGSSTTNQPCHTAVKLTIDKPNSYTQTFQAIFSSLFVYVKRKRNDYQCLRKVPNMKNKDWRQQMERNQLRKQTMQNSHSYSQRDKILQM